MISPIEFKEELERKGVGFFVGVPDSTLKGFCKYLTTQDNHMVSANEGTAIGIATGYYLATNKLALVYLQNSGLGNATNPLTSLASKEVYSIPMLLLIGWRGKPGVKDEPQHQLQGRIMIDQLKLLGIHIIELTESNYKENIKTAIEYSKNNLSPVALITEKIFEDFNLLGKTENELELTREDAINVILDNINSNDILVATTGFTSRELFSLRKKRNESNNDFLTVGSMGHASQIALGIALNTSKKVICLDGDGAALMHLGGMVSIGSAKIDNLIHIVFNNSCHESVGGIPTTAVIKKDYSNSRWGSNYYTNFSFQSIAHCCRYDKSLTAFDKDYLESALKQEGKVFIEVMVKGGYKKDLLRPDSTPIENKERVMKKILNWKDIWNRKPIKNNLTLNSLISLDGFENNSEITLNDWINYVQYIKEKIGIKEKDWVLELGCGSGAFLYPLYEWGINVSGCDYSKSLISNIKNIIPGNFTICSMEDFIVDRVYDHIISNSAFQYFKDFIEVESIICKYLPFVKSTMSILDLNDIDKKDLYLETRGNIYPEHLFYSKEWWKNLANTYNLSIEIEDQIIPNYSNTPFRFNVFLRKR